MDANKDVQKVNWLGSQLSKIIHQVENVFLLAIGIFTVVAMVQEIYVIARGGTVAGWVPVGFMASLADLRAPGSASVRRRTRARCRRAVLERAG